MLFNLVASKSPNVLEISKNLLRVLVLRSNWEFRIFVTLTYLLSQSVDFDSCFWIWSYAWGPPSRPWAARRHLFGSRTFWDTSSGHFAFYHAYVGSYQLGTSHPSSQHKFRRLWRLTFSAFQTHLFWRFSTNSKVYVLVLYFSTFRTISNPIL